MFALPATSLMTDSVSIALNLEQKTLELLNAPTTVGINVKVKLTSSSGVVLSTSDSVGVDGTNNLTVDLSKDLSGEDVAEFLLGIQTMDCLQVLSKLETALELSGHGT